MRMTDELLSVHRRQRKEEKRSRWLQAIEITREREREREREGERRGLTLWRWQWRVATVMAGSWWHRG
ncbi:hypothetical protein HYC85_021257 [Camellia sinensis]|uniref:Uncharacterized protein n=1 Tax=Camellia sinensis TaxID=4442 RepID=A0A7J7GH46_CAMSI|nr:hypothetical protein HYC85_021257 [Camellia sinensis]